MTPAYVLDPDELRRIVREELRAALEDRPASPAGVWLTTEEAAEVAGVSPKTVRAWVAAGLRARRRGRRIVIARADLDAYRAGTPVAAGLLSTLTPPAP